MFRDGVRVELQADHCTARVVGPGCDARTDWVTLDRPGEHEARLAALVEFLLWCAEL